MRDSDWSREILLRSDWSGPSVATMTTLEEFICPSLKKKTNFKLQSRRYIRILRCQLLAAICKTVKDNSRTLYPNQGIRSDPNILKTVRREWIITSIMSIGQ